MKLTGFLKGKRPWLRVAIGLRSYRIWPAVLRTYRNWPLWFLDRFGVIRSGTPTYVLRNNLRFATRPITPDRDTIDQMWIYKDYVPDWGWIRQNDVVIDIGAYIGAFAVLAAWLAPKGKVYAFEPQPENFLLVSENARLNHLENLIPCNLAVAGQRNDRFLIGAGTIGSFYDGWHKRTSGREPTLAPVKVRCTTLEEIFVRYRLERVRFLKSDCEGAEFEIFLNTPRKYLQRIDRISLEYHLANEQCSVVELRKALEAADFEVRVAEYGVLGMMYARNRSVEPSSDRR